MIDLFFFFFFKQKTAYEMRISDWSSDVCSSDLGLRHCAFRTVDKQDNPVNHGEDALNLTAEIGVAGRINDVYPRAVPFDAGALGKNRDPSFFFEVACVHGALFDAVLVAKGARLPKKLSHQRGFAMIAET